MTENTSAEPNQPTNDTPDEDLEDDTFDEHDDWDEDDEDDLYENAIWIRGKWSMDGATSLQDAANRLKDYAKYLENLASQGYELLDTIEDDYGHASQQTPEPPK